MKKELQIFKNSQFGEVRVTEVDGKPMFCLPDLCNVLGLTNPSSIKNRLDGEDVQLIDLHALNSIEGIGNQTVNFVNESGFYDVLLQSSSPKVKPFRKWVTSEVLPAIRKHGGYLTPQKIEEALLNPDVLIQLATNLKEERQKRLEAENIIEKQAPKVKFYEDVMSSDNLMTITEIAKNYGWSGVSLNGILHGAGVQYKKGRHWFIAAKYQDKDYVRFIPVYQYEKNGVQIVRNEMKWTETGRKFIHELLVENGLINRQKSLML
jgi:prophage antirepressor-like protein